MINRNCPICNTPLTEEKSITFNNNPDYIYYYCGSEKKKSKKHYYLQTYSNNKLILVRFLFGYKYDVDIYLAGDLTTIPYTIIAFRDKWGAHLDDDEVFAFVNRFDGIISPKEFTLKSVIEKYEPIINSFIFK